VYASRAAAGDPGQARLRRTEPGGRAHGQVEFHLPGTSAHGTARRSVNCPPPGGRPTLKRILSRIPRPSAAHRGTAATFGRGSAGPTTRDESQTRPVSVLLG
jgi:hypothetical protein